MAYRNVNKIICGKLNVNLCPRNFSSNSDIVCACLRRYYHQKSGSPYGKYMTVPPVLRHSKSCLLYSESMHQTKPFSDLHYSTHRYGHKHDKENSPGHSFPSDRRFVESFTNKLNTRFGPLRHQSEGNIKKQNQSLEKDQFRTHYKSETHTLGIQQIQKKQEPVKLKYNATVCNLPQTKTTNSGFTHQFLLPQKNTLEIDFKNELLSTDGNMNEKLGLINPKARSRKITQNELLGQDNEFIPSVPENLQSPNLFDNRRQFSKFNRYKSAERQSSRESTPRDSYQQKKKVVHPVEHIKFQERKIVKEPSKADVVTETGNRATKYAFQHLAFKSNKEPSTFRKIPSRNFYSKSRLNPVAFRLKRDAISPDVNEMHIRHNLKSPPARTVDPLNLHNFYNIPTNNLQNERKSKLTTIS